MERITPILTQPPSHPRANLAQFRLVLVGLGISLWALGIGARLLQLQVLSRKFFERQAARQSERTINLDSRRGAILDRNGHELALSVDAESIYAVPQDIGDAARAATALAKVLQLDAGEKKDLQAQLQRNRAFVWVKRKVDPTTARSVRDLQLDGVGFLTENRRYYPKRELASQVLGYVGLDNQGMSGLEYAYEEAIRGRGAKVAVQIDAKRRLMGHIEKPSTDGSSLVLTIEESIQFIAESELERAMTETGSIAGTVLVLDPETGEILAMANRPTFNPNSLRGAPSSHWKNRAVADAFEPGSVFKIVTSAAALSEKVVDPDEIIDCGGGSIEVAGTLIHDHAVFYDLAFRDVLAKSSDIGFIRVAQRLGRDNFYRYVRDFGFGQTTGIELPGESSGLLRPLNRWSAVSLASMAFGQEVGVTSLQMALAAGVVANGGYLMKPLIVESVRDATGRTLRSSQPMVVRRVLEPQTTDMLRDLLKGVVRNGTGKAAAVDGYEVAGKTGTAQKIDASGHYSLTDYVASFVGFVPAQHPSLLILVSLDSPKGPHEGGQVAAPVFARVATQALRSRAVPPDDRSRVLEVASPALPGVTRVAYRPQPLPAPQPPSNGDPQVMPDLRGVSAREAAIAAGRLGLIVELHGSGRVTGQTPLPGTELEPGVTCVLTLTRGSEEPR
jgi:cell division protein FtsI (penicillin-binding protein 3)